MSGTRTARVVLAVPRAVVGFLGLTAVIVGILAMHVWMGGHGPTAAHGVHVLPAQTQVAAVVEPVAHHAAPAPAALHHSAVASVPAAPQHAVTAPAPVLAAGADSGQVHGCADSCEDDEAMALGLCVLAFIVVTLLAFLLPAGRLVPGTVLLRGPPLIRLRPLAVPAPCLIRLCISRT
ncbi:hypothetical protein [Arthrobacter subterraneus]|uniref:hypothetical protein n=1 Tax=Arthrobacter subterraneus TaxID=335973 RepID=UPI003821DA92